MRSAVEAATGRTVRALGRVGGGDINEAFKVQFEDESFGFVKTRPGAAPGQRRGRHRQHQEDRDGQQHDGGAGGGVEVVGGHHPGE